MNPRAGPDPGAEASIAWPDLRGRLDQVGALAAELAAAAEERARLARRLEAALEGRRESLRQGAALDEMRRRLERRRARADDLAVARRRAAEGVERQKEQMQAQIERVMPLSRALAAAHRQVQEAKELKSAEKARLGDLQRLLRTRQQSVVAQVAALYPVRFFRELPVTQNHHSHSNGESRTPSEENGGTSTRERKWNAFARCHQISTCWSLHVFWLANWKAQDKAAELQSQGASEVSSCAWICSTYLVVFTASSLNYDRSASSSACICDIRS